MSGPASWADAKRVFEAALDLPEADRAAFVDSVCDGNPALRDEIRSLLMWHSGSTGFLETPAGKVADLPAEAESAARLIGTSVGAWRILDAIGSGGMGVVYRAERADAAFRRHAALKVVRPGPDSPQILQRFQLERETLAALDHPNIARLMDGGTTADGQPFLVMELVDGVPIDRYCDEASPVDRGAARSVPHGVRRRSVRAREPRRPSRPQARQHPRDEGRRAEAARLRCRQDPVARRRARRRPGGVGRHVDHDARLRQPGAGERAAEHHSDRRLLAGRAAVRAAHRRAPVSG